MESNPVQIVMVALTPVAIKVAHKIVGDVSKFKMPTLTPGQSRDALEILRAIVNQTTSD